MEEVEVKIYIVSPGYYEEPARIEDESDWIKIPQEKYNEYTKYVSQIKINNSTVVIVKKPTTKETNEILDILEKSYQKEKQKRLEIEAREKDILIKKQEKKKKEEAKKTEKEKQLFEELKKKYMEENPPSLAFNSKDE